MNVLIACEESQTVCLAFRKKGHNAYSCDIVDCSGGYPEYHIKRDVLEVMKGGTFKTQGGQEVTIDKWDLMIAHPPCTFLSSSGASWYYHPEDKGLPVEQRRPHPRYPNRAKDRDDGKKFFMEFVKSDIEKIAIENPVGIMSTCYRKPDQIVQPFMFGHEARKATCLWLKGLPKLTPTNIVGEGEIAITKSGKKVSKWYYDAISLPKEERQKLRSKTFQGIADAMADQWG